MLVLLQGEENLQRAVLWFSPHLDLANHPSNVKDLQHQQNEQQSNMNAMRTSSDTAIIYKNQ